MKTLRNLQSGDYDNLLSKAIKAGTKSKFFGGFKEGPYLIQQDLSELAALCNLLKMEKKGRELLYLEIGVAAAGTTRFIYENVGFCFAALIDKPIIDQKEAGENLRRIKSYAIHYGDSRDPSANTFLFLLGFPYDVIVIDGDHSYDSVVSDLELASKHTHSETLFVFHDIRPCPGNEGPARVWGNLADFGMERVAEIINKDWPCKGAYSSGIGVARRI